MGKPSIFSREYEKKMKKRRRNIAIISFAIILMISGLVFKFIYKPVDLTNVRNNIQAWIDSDSNNSEESSETITEETIEEKAVVEEEVEKPLEESINITLVSGIPAKAIYKNESDKGLIFKSFETTDNGISYDISSSGKQLLITDTNSVITIYNVDGTSKVVSKDQYVSTSGEVFTKESAIQSNSQYLWNINSKFIGDEKIIFVTNRPYFGNASLKQYIWITDLQTNEDKVLWDLAGANIEIGTMEEKGLKLVVDGNAYYMNSDGNYTK